MDRTVGPIAVAVRIVTAAVESGLWLASRSSVAPRLCRARTPRRPTSARTRAGPCCAPASRNTVSSSSISSASRSSRPTTCSRRTAHIPDGDVEQFRSKRGEWLEQFDKTLCDTVRAPGRRWRAAPGTPAGRRCIARHAARADGVRPGPPDRPQGRDAIPRSLHAARDRRTRPARRGADRGSGQARHRQPVLDFVHPRCRRLLGASCVPESPRVAALHGARAGRSHAGDQQALHLAQPLPRRPRRAARDQGRPARSQRIPAVRRQGAPADVLQDAARRIAGRAAGHRGAGDAVRSQCTPRTGVR